MAVMSVPGLGAADRRKTRTASTAARVARMMMLAPTTHQMYLRLTSRRDTWPRWGKKKSKNGSVHQMPLFVKLVVL